FLTAVALVPLEHHVIFVGQLYHFANWRFHSRHHFHFARVRECLGRRIIRAVGELDTGSHVINPRANKFLLHVVVALDAHSFELDVFHFTGLIGHLHFACHIHHHITTTHNALAAGGAFGFLRFGVRVGVHPHFDGVIPIAIHVCQHFVVFIEFPHLHHLFHHFLRIRWLTGCAGRLSGCANRHTRRRCGGALR